MPKLRHLAAGAAIALGSLGIGPAPRADAHIWDNYAHWYCAYWRPAGATTVLHAVPDYLNSSYIRYYCRVLNPDLPGDPEGQYWVVVFHPIEAGNSTLAGRPSLCAPYSTIVCHEPG